MTTSLVTGGAGFIGSHLVRGLLSRGEHVRVLDNFDTGTLENLSGVDCEIIDGDIRDVDACVAAARGCRTVYHLAAIASVPRSVADPALSFSVNATGSHNVLEAARLTSVGRVVCASSAAVYGSDVPAFIDEAAPLRPQSPYGAEKACLEQLASAYSNSLGLEVVPLRFFNVYGARQDPSSSYSGVIAAFLGALVRQRIPVVHGDGTQSRDFIHVSDVVQACILASSAARPGRAYNVGTGVPTSVIQLLRALQKSLAASEDVKWGEARAGDVHTSCAEVSCIKALGFGVNMPLQKGLNLTAAWYEAQLKN